jgi:hypothetical protein
MGIHDFPEEGPRAAESAVRCLEKLLEEARGLRGTPQELVGISYVALYRDMTSRWGSSVRAQHVDSAEVVYLSSPPPES